METKVTLDSVFVPSKDVVARDIEGELIIVPLASGIGDAEDEIYALNETGRMIWVSLDGRKLREVIEALEVEFESKPGEIETDVLGLVTELTKRKMLAAV